MGRIRWKRILGTIGIMIAAGFIGLIIGYNLVPDIQAAASHVPWENLGTPPAKALKISGYAPCSKSSGVVVLTQSGKQYQVCSAGQWEDWKYGENYNGMPVPCQTDHPTQYNPGLSQIPGKTIDCIMTYTIEWVHSESVYTVQDDGSVWRWIFSYGIGTYFAYALVGMITGLAAGVVLAVVLWKLKG
jgi:hypothetical protein